jgi:hypothetical protein
MLVNLLQFLGRKMDAWNSDLLLHVIQFLSVADSSRLAATSKRFFYLVSNYRRHRGPQLTAVCSHIPGVQSRQLEMRQVCREAVNRLQTEPTFALSFETFHGNQPAAEELPIYLPPSTVILSVSADTIQSSVGGYVECQSRASLMLGSMPPTAATIVPFLFGPNMDKLSSHDLVEELRVAEEVKGKGFWKVAMIFAAGNINMVAFQDFLQELQGRYPTAAIVGGICERGHVSVMSAYRNDTTSRYPSSHLIRMLKLMGEKPVPGQFGRKELVDRVNQALLSYKYMLEMVEEGVFGVVMGGEVPVRSIVSRGLRSLTYNGRPQPSTPYYVKESSFHRPEDTDYMFRAPDNAFLPCYHKIGCIENRETGMLYTMLDLFREFGEPGMLGLRKPEADGFSLETLGPFQCILQDDARSPFVDEYLVGLNLDLFKLDGLACMEDMEIRMQQLKEIMQEDELLGALMFSCGGRGPSASSFIPELMSDATRFAKAFPRIPCLGFYCGGEIGPMALAGRQSVFQTGKVRPV